MAEAGPESGSRGEDGGDAVPAPPGAPLDPEQLRRVLEQVAKAQLLPPPQQLEAVCAKASSREKRVKPWSLPAALQPLPSPGPQPAFQLLVHRPQPTLQPVPVKRTVGPKDPSMGSLTPASGAASHPPAVTPICSGPASAVISGVHTGHAQKLRKSLNVQTRSGRISRPPRYKARDYKFIKTEDLADDRASDSDDYSELSAEEDELRARPLLLDLDSSNLRPKLFQCQACDKAYIGRGGLARHFKLHPGHGQLQSQHTLGSAIEGHQDMDPASLTSVKPSRPAGIRSARGNLQSCQFVDVREALASTPEGGRYPAPWPSETPLEGPERSGVSAAPAEGTDAQDAAESQARLREILQQCGQEQLVELVLPRLARAVTVFEFLLTRVRQGPPAQPLFPAVYREFELLHRMVKGLCQDYVDSGGGREPLEVSNSELAESLGIPEQLLRKDCGHEAGVPLRGSEWEPEVGKMAEQGCTPVKRPRRDSAPDEEPWAAASRGPAGNTESVPARPTGGATDHSSIVYTGQQLIPFADSEAGSDSAQPRPCALHVPWATPGTPTADPMGTFSQEGSQGHPVHGAPSHLRPAAGGPGERKAPCHHGPDGDLLENILDVDRGPMFELKPQLSTAGPLGSHPESLDASPGPFEGTMNLEVTKGPPALIQTSEGFLLPSPGPVSGGDIVIVGRVGGPALHGGLPQGAPPEAMGPVPSQRGGQKVLSGFLCV